MWMSLAPRFTASVRTTFTSLTIGASSAAFSSSASSDFFLLRLQFDVGLTDLGHRLHDLLEIFLACVVP